MTFPFGGQEWYGQEVTVVQGASFTWCTSIDTGRSFPFDIYIEAMRVIVEVDGPHHLETSPIGGTIFRSDKSVMFTRCIALCRMACVSYGFLRKIHGRIRTTGKRNCKAPSKMILLPSIGFHGIRHCTIVTRNCPILRKIDFR